MKPSREARARWLLRHIPTIFLTDTYQVMLAVAMVGMGLATLLALLIGDSGAIQRTLPILALRILWCGAFLVGGAAQIIGLQMTHKSTERFGKGLCMIGCSAYALVLFSVGTWPAAAVGFVFVFFVAAYGLRILVSKLAEIAPSSTGGV